MGGVIERSIATMPTTVKEIIDCSKENALSIIKFLNAMIEVMDAHNDDRFASITASSMIRAIGDFMEHGIGEEAKEYYGCVTTALLSGELTWGYDDDEA